MASRPTTRSTRIGSPLSASTSSCRACSTCSGFRERLTSASAPILPAKAIQGPLWQSFIANGQPVEWHFFSDANHGFRHPDNDGFQPHYADLAWPLVTDFLARRVRAAPLDLARGDRG